MSSLRLPNRKSGLERIVIERCSPDIKHDSLLHVYVPVESTLIRKDKRWPDSVQNTLCIHCCTTITAPPIPIPTDENDDEIEVLHNVACSFECAKAYIQSLRGHQMQMQMQILQRLYRLSTNSDQDVVAAPPREMLQCFGGPLPLELFRKYPTFTETVCYTKPFITEQMVVDNRVHNEARLQHVCMQMGSQPLYEQYLKQKADEETTKTNKKKTPRVVTSRPNSLTQYMKQANRKERSEAKDSS